VQVLNAFACDIGLLNSTLHTILLWVDVHSREVVIYGYNIKALKLKRFVTPKCDVTSLIIIIIIIIIIRFICGAKC
jgi:hypothetical protein